MHSIRLRGPWELLPLARAVRTAAGMQEVAERLPAGGRTQVPGDGRELLGDEFTGRARFTRRFNLPTNLDAHERVFLVIAGLDARASVQLNGEPLHATPDALTSRRHDVTPHLKLHNALEIEILYPGDPIGEVSLEIGL
jgi:hypothetical protein